MHLCERRRYPRHSVPGIVLHEAISSASTGAAVHGWNGDNAATFACGEVSETAQRLMDVTKEALMRGHCGRADKANRVWATSARRCSSTVEDAGFSVVRTYVGHGVSRELHEDRRCRTSARRGRGPHLVNGMVLAIRTDGKRKSHVVKTMSDGWTTKTVDGGLAAHFEHNDRHHAERAGHSPQPRRV